MISNVGLIKDFWVEMTSMACYIVNHAPSVALDFKSPQEIFLGTLVDYFDFKAFGCPV